jgi:uncharacterized protein YndB with AHSA1/START domain
MTAFLYSLLGVALAVGALRLIGSRLPRGHRAASRIRLEHPPEIVWAVVRNLEEVPQWWAEVHASERLSDQVGQERYRQTLGNNFSMTIMVAQSVPSRLLRTVIDAPPGASFGGAWIHELTPVGGGVEIRITEEGWIANPFFRLAARVMGYHRTLDSYLASLARRLGETALPEHMS